MKEQLGLLKEQLELARIFNAASSFATLTIYYQNKPEFNGVCSRNNLTKIKEAYVINLDVYESTRTHWIALHVNVNSIVYADSCRVEHIPKEIKKLIGNKNIVTNIYRIQA